MKQEVQKVNIHNILPISEVNGPGKRFVMWVQGCMFHCKGCFNPGLLSFKTKKLMTIEEIINAIPLSKVEGVTISGGEPFCQARSLSVLAKAIVQNGLSLMVYTGYDYKDILKAGNIYFKQFIQYIDILIDGPYRKNNEPDTIWAGSGNQEIIFLTGKYRSYEKKIYKKHRYIEYHIGNDGLVKATGF